MAKKKTLPKKRAGRRRRENRPLSAEEDAFCQGICDGMSAGQSYREHISKDKRCTMAVAYNEASKLLKLREIIVRIESGRRDMAYVLEKVLGVKRETIARRLWDIIDTPVGDVDEHSHLASEIRLHSEGKTIKMPSKTEAIRELTRLTGWGEEKAGGISLVVSEEVNQAVAALFKKKPIQPAKPK